MIDLKIGDCREVLKTLPSQSVDCCVTSPPYFGLRDYGTGKWIGGDPNCSHIFGKSRNDSDREFGTKEKLYVQYRDVCKDCGAVRKDDQIGLEQSPKEFVDNLVKVFKEVKRVLKDDGTLWLNLGDSYSGNNSRASNNGRAGYGKKREGVFNKTKNIPPKNLIGIPFRVAFGLQDDGWILRQDIIWHKPNPIPESVQDRCTKAHEYIFLFSKKPRYYFDNKSIQENSNCSDDKKNKRSVWTITPDTFREAHFATYPPELIEPCILAGCPINGTIIDPFSGAGTTGLVADRLKRNAILIELNKNFAEISKKRLLDDAPLFVNLK
tara:strand:- start:1997 stop:2965 length:969 start_codon:yes stop_codon:yes gene_type:complete